MKKRTSLYKDHVADSLGTFINSACQIIKEKYAQDGEFINIFVFTLIKIVLKLKVLVLEN